MGMFLIKNNMTFKEEWAFNKFKDKPFVNAETLKGAITKKFKGVDAAKVYVKILNYQLKKYGGQLQDRVDINITPFNEY